MADYRQPRSHSRPYPPSPVASSHRDDYRTRSRSPGRRREQSHERYYERARDRDRDRDDRMRRDDRYERHRRDDYYDHEDYDRHYDRDFRRDRNEDDHRSWRRREQTEPNNYVILQDLPRTVEEHDIQQTLESLEASIENVRLIRDRKTGFSRCFAFVKFTSVEHARQFMDKRYPYIMMNDHRVRIDYSHNSGAGDDEAWTCRNCAVLNYKKRATCFQCSLPMQESIPTPGQTAYHHHPSAASGSPASGSAAADYGINDGTRDVGHAPHHVLLVRGLDNLTTGEGVHAAFVALSSAVRRTLLVKDRMSRMSWGFAFVEFPDVQSASHVLATITSQQPRRGDAKHLRRRPTPGVADFSVDGRPVTVSFAHPNSLAPVYVPSEWTVMGDAGTVLTYWDEQAYPCEFVVPVGGAVEAEKDGKKEKDGNEGVAGKAEKGAGMKEEKEKAPSPANANVDDELSAFYADMGATIFGGSSTESIFAVPKK